VLPGDEDIRKMGPKYDSLEVVTQRTAVRRARSEDILKGEIYASLVRSEWGIHDADRLPSNPHPDVLWCCKKE
jgi:hypothetical protein